MQFLELLVFDIRRRIHHKVLRLLVQREGNDFANRLSTGHQHDQTIQTKGQTTVRRRTELQRIEQEAELLLLLVGLLLF
mgnify:CR=1 FL=1